MTIRVNREIVLKSLLNKIKEAKRLNMTEIKYPIKELDDLAYVVYQLMAEDISKILSLNDKPEPEPKKQPVKKPKKVLEEIRPSQEQVSEVPTVQPEPVKEHPKPEPKPILPPKPTIPNTDDLFDDEDDNDNTLYGGTW